MRAVDVAGDTLTGLSFTLTFAGEQAQVHSICPAPMQSRRRWPPPLSRSTVVCRLEEVAEMLGALRPAKRRGEVKAGVNGCIVIDDSYNSNRQSALAALETLRGAQIPAGALRWFVFGDMLELGDYSPRSMRR